MAGQCPYVSRRQLPIRTRRLICNIFAIQKCARHFGLEREIHILRNVPGKPGNLRGVEFRGDNADEMAAGVEQWSTAVAGLHRRADLKIARVIAQPGERAHIANREIGGRGENPGERITQRHHRVAGANRAAVPENRNGSERDRAPNDSQIVLLIAFDDESRR